MLFSTQRRATGNKKYIGEVCVHKECILYRVSECAPAAESEWRMHRIHRNWTQCAARAVLGFALRARTRHDSTRIYVCLLWAGMTNWSGLMVYACTYLLHPVQRGKNMILLQKEKKRIRALCWCVCVHTGTDEKNNMRVREARGQAWKEKITFFCSSFCGALKLDSTRHNLNNSS